MKRNIVLFLEDILEAIRLMEEYTQDITFASFKKNVEKQDAIVRRIEIIGEATKNIPQSIRKKYTDVPWRDVAGMRDVLIHAYFGINVDKVWNVLKKDVPLLKKQIQKILENEE